MSAAGDEPSGCVTLLRVTPGSGVLAVVARSWYDAGLAAAPADAEPPTRPRPPSAAMPETSTEVISAVIRP